MKRQCLLLAALLARALGQDPSRHQVRFVAVEDEVRLEVLEPIPKASESTATTANRGLRRSARKAYRRSEKSPVIAN